MALSHMDKSQVGHKWKQCKAYIPQPFPGCQLPAFKSKASKDGGSQQLIQELLYPLRTIRVFHGSIIEFSKINTEPKFASFLTY